MPDKLLMLTERSKHWVDDEGLIIPKAFIQTSPTMLEGDETHPAAQVESKANAG